MGSYASLAVAGAGAVGGVGRVGTPGSTHADGWPSDLTVATAEARAWLDGVESALSPYRDDSDLSRWRAGRVPLRACSPLLWEVIDAVGALEDLTDGGFHPYDRQGRFDPTGYVKGWAVERAVGILTDAGFTDASLGVGGDIQMVGRAENGRPWRVAVTDPTDERRIVAVVQARADGRPSAVATSGEAQRGDHIWAGLKVRPGGASPTDSLASITVVGPDLGRVDAFATAIWALAKGRPLADAWGWLPGLEYEAFAVTRTGEIRCTPGMGAHLARAAA
jgi:thiamine biosynthesis lipoprotein